jgi:hypothetical protein
MTNIQILEEICSLWECKEGVYMVFVVLQFKVS